MQMTGSIAGNAARPVPTIPGLIDQIMNRLSSIEERQTVVSNAIYRIITPPPVNAVGTDGKVSREPATVEESLNAIIRRLDMISEAEVRHSDTLNGAV